MSQIYYKEGDFDGLIATAPRPSQNAPPQGADEIQLLVGDAFYQKSDFPKAAEYFAVTPRAARKWTHGAVQNRVRQLQMGDFKGAIGSLKGVAPAKTPWQNAAYHMGLSYLQLSKSSRR
jgi:hypothetical protein